jgi:predicted nucleic acid-binding protein
MLIVLDTNIIQSDLLIRKSGFQILLDYAARTESRVILPRIVLEELAANYARMLQERSEVYGRAVEKLNGILLDPVADAATIHIDASVAAYIDYVRRKLRVPDESIIEYGESQLRDAVTRAIQRRPPCHVSEKAQIRDAIIWNCILTLDGQEEIVFVSNNKTDFAMDAELHPTLREETVRAALTLDYLQSLEEFGKKHASPIAFITEDWITSKIDNQDLVEAISDAAADYARGAVLRSFRTFIDGVDEFRVAGGNFEPDGYFVYNMQDGDKRLHVNWHGRVEVAYRIRTLPSGYSFAVDPTKGESGYTPYGYFDAEEVDVSATIELRASVTTSAVIRDGDVVEWGVLFANLNE